jgi:hypothetical protein
MNKQLFRQIFLLAVVSSSLLMIGCQQSEKVDVSTGNYGKASEETQLPPQGRPPAQGEDVNSRAKKAAGM